VTASLKDFLIGHFSPEAAGLVATSTLLPLGQQAALEVAPSTSALPLEFALRQAIPNPFRGSTSIGYALPEPSTVRLRVFNVLGQQVASLVNGTVGAGYHAMEWNARDRAGRPVSSGIYFYRLEATGLNTGTSHQMLKKMLLLK
jgi:flagellar hook assembly protein FlgD